MTPRMLSHVRVGVTLAVLLGLLWFAVDRGLGAVTEPFPRSEDPPVCVDSPVDRGEVVLPDGVTVSVVNAGRTSGLAGRTLDDLVARGFARGELANIRDDGVTSAQIWVSGGRSPAVRLVRSYLGDDVRVVERESSVAGVTVVVGDEFAGVRDGRPRVKAGAAGEVCGPPELA